jgi:hypothetical protein
MLVYSATASRSDRSAVIMGLTASRRSARLTAGRRAGTKLSSPLAILLGSRNASCQATSLCIASAEHERPLAPRARLPVGDLAYEGTSVRLVPIVSSMRLHGNE